MTPLPSAVRVYDPTTAQEPAYLHLFGRGAVSYQHRTESGFAPCRRRFLVSDAADNCRLCTLAGSPSRLAYVPGFLLASGVLSPGPRMLDQVLVRFRDRDLSAITARPEKSLIDVEPASWRVVPLPLAPRQGFLLERLDWCLVDATLPLPNLNDQLAEVIAFGRIGGLVSEALSLIAKGGAA
jgi:hypothetical protein